MKMKNLTMAIAAGLLAVMGAKQADAHATSIGYANAGPGSVAIWLGTYNHGTSTHHLEASMNLVGVNGNPYLSTTNPFTLAAGAGPVSGWSDTTGYQAGKPTGLIDGTTNFFSPLCSFSDQSALVGTDPNCFGGIDHWQGAIFTGLSAGDYKFTWQPTGATAEWSVANGNMNGIFTISGTVINPNQVPLPAAAPLLLGGLGLMGALRARRKKAA